MMASIIGIQKSNSLIFNSANLIILSQITKFNSVNIFNSREVFLVVTELLKYKLNSL